MYKSFTLIEIFISVAIFMFVLLSFPAFLSSIFASEFRAIAMKKLADDTRTGLEIMGREMRLAKKATPTLNCTLPTGDSFKIENSDQKITFIDFEGICVTYDFNAATGIVSKTIAPSLAQTFLGGNIKVAETRFLLIGGPSQQPRVVVRVKVSTADPTSSGGVLEIPLETTISQREINL